LFSSSRHYLLLHVHYLRLSSPDVAFAIITILSTMPTPLRIISPMFADFHCFIFRHATIIVATPCAKMMSARMSAMRCAARREAAGRGDAQRA